MVLVKDSDEFILASRDVSIDVAGVSVIASEECCNVVGVTCSLSSGLNRDGSCIEDMIARCRIEGNGRDDPRLGSSNEVRSG